MITSHALGTSTSRMAFRFNLLAIDRDPRVATSLSNHFWISQGDHIIQSEEEGKEEKEEKYLPYSSHSMFGRREYYNQVSQSLSLFLFWLLEMRHILS